MADIRKRTGKKGVTYQVRYPCKSAKTGYAYETFSTRKEALEFVSSGKAHPVSSPLDHSISTLPEAVESWLKICEKEGTDGQEPVTKYTIKTYRYRAQRMLDYNWPCSLQEH